MLVSKRGRVQNQVSNLSAHSRQIYDYMEIFSGRGWVRRAMASSGKTTAAFDILLGEPRPDKQDAMDLTTPSGFWLLGTV